MRFRLLFNMAALSSFALVSCKKDLEPQETSLPITAATTSAPNTAQPVKPAPKPGQPQPQVTNVATQPVAAGMNPAHGQPGHRCDISVGAPLNGPAKQATPVVATQTTQTAPSVQTATKTTPAKTTTAKGMNPAHGQPGHRCDISVGAPLNSPPKQPTAAKPVSGSSAATTTAAKSSPMSIDSDGKISGGSGGNYTITRTDNNTGKKTVTKAGASEIPALLQAPAEAKTTRAPAAVKSE